MRDSGTQFTHSGDLADSGHLVLHAPPPTFDGNPTPEILTRLLEGLRAR